MKFSEEDTVKFVQLYVDNECLWNMSLPNYRNKVLRQKAIESIICDMDLPGFGIVEVKNKIKNIRSTYNQEILKIKRSAKSGAGADDLYVPPMKWFILLDVVMKKMKGTTDVDIITTLGSEDQFFENNRDHDLSNDSDTVTDNYSIIQTENERPTPPQESNTTKKARGNKRKLMEISSAVKELKAASENLLQPDQVLTKNEVFGNYIAKGLDTLSPMQSALAQQEIQNIITKYTISCLQSQANYSPNSDNIIETMIVENDMDLI